MTGVDEDNEIRLRTSENTLISGWHLNPVPQAHKAKERGQSAKRGRSTVSPTSASPKRVGGEGRGRGISPGKDCRANVRTPTTNENLADFEQVKIFFSVSADEIMLRSCR